jgi:lipopolysaccharide export system permease protein
MKEVSGSVLAVTFVLLLIFLGNQLVRFLNYAASGKIAANILLQVMGFEVAFLLALLLPLGVYLGTMTTYGRLYADNELRVMCVYGLSVKHLFLITGGLAIFVAAMTAVLTLGINPYLAAEKEKLIAEGGTAGNSINTLLPGRFQVSSDDNRVIYVESIARNHQRANNIFVAEKKRLSPDSSESAWSVLSAAQGYQKNGMDPIDRFVVALDGYRYEGTPGQNAYKVIQFKKYAVRLPEQTAGSQRQAQEVIPTAVLWKNYWQNPRNAAELQWRLSVPLSVFLLAMLAVPLSQVQPRQGRYAQLLPAVLIYIIYVELLFVARDWVEQKILPVSMGLWGVHGVLALLVVLIGVWQSGKLLRMRKN